VSTEALQLLKDMRPADAERVRELFSVQRRQALLDEIIANGTPTRPRSWSLARVGNRRRILAPALGTLLAAAVAAVLASSAAHAPSAKAAVSFRTATGGEIVATVTEPFAAQSRLDAAFAAHRLDIHVSLIPVPPSLVGTVVYTSDEAGTDGIEPLQGGHCLTGGGGCAIGLRVPTTFTGQGYVTLGRPARAGEGYESGGNAFAPGEVLHCSGLLGAKVGEALPALEADGLTVMQWASEVTTDSTGHTVTEASPPLGNYIWSIDLVAAGKIRVWSKPAPWPDTPLTGSSFNAGC
jgi:hypothetical protein